MSLETVFDRIKDINAGITGIVTAYSYDDLPQTLPTGNLPAAVPLLDEGDIAFSAGQLSHNKHNIWLCVYVSPLGQGSIAQNFGDAAPFIDRFIVRYAQALTLDELATVKQALITGYRVGLLPPFDTDYIGAALRLEVWCHEAIVTGA